MRGSRKVGLLACGVVVVAVLLVVEGRGSERSAPTLPDAIPIPPALEPADLAELIPPESRRAEAASISGGARTPVRTIAGPHRVRRPVRRIPDATLVVHTVAEDTGWGLADVMVHVGAPRWAGSRGLATSDAGFVECPVPSRARLTLNAEGRDLLFGRATVAVPPLVPGERREVVARIPVGGLRYFGRVLDSEGEFPVVGADVAVSIAGEEARSRVSTDAYGCFEVVVAARDPREPLEVRIGARGYGPALGAVESGHDAPESAAAFRLRPSAALVGRVVDGFGRPLPGSPVTVRAPAGALWQPRPATVSFERQDVEPWFAETDAGGGFHLEGLPARTPLRVELARASRLPSEVQDVVLNPQEVRRLDLVLASPVRLSLLVLDPDGRPRPGIQLLVERAPSATPGHLARASAVGLGDMDGMVIRTDSSGRFSTNKAVPGLWRIGPLADHPSLAPFGELVEIRPAPAEQSAVLRLRRGLYVRGRVLDAGGTPPRRATVSVRSKWCDVERHELCDARGGFAIGPLAAGEYLLRVRPKNGSFDGEEVRAQAGAADLVLRLPESGGTILGEVFARGAPAQGALVRILPEEGRLAGAWNVSQGSPFVFKHLPPGRYDLIATDERGGWGRAVGLAPFPGGHGPARIELEPAASVRVTYVGESPRAEIRALRDGHVVAVDEVSSGADVVLWVPPGALTLELSPVRGFPVRTVWSRQVMVRVGDATELSLP